MEASVSAPPDVLDPRAGDAPAQEQGDQDPPLDPLPPEASSSSSPDEAVAGTSCTGPPPIDLRAHQDLLRRVARNMDLQAEEIVEVQDPIVNILAADAPSRVALPLIRTIQANANTIWQTPASIPPTARGVERKYFVPSKDYEYLYTHPQPCSLVVASVNARERHGQQAAAPKSKEAKRLDLFGRKVYSAGGLQLRAANQQALLSRYNFNSWNSMGKFKELVPQESREEFGALVEEGKKVARTSLQASLDIADSAARTLASGIAMQRTSWLQVSGLPPELQQTLQDLPFEGQGLFSEKTDSRLQSLKDSRTIMRSLGMHVAGPQRRPFRPQRFYPPDLVRDRTRPGGEGEVVDEGEPALNPVRTKGHQGHPQGPGRTFEGAVEDGAPVIPQDPAPSFRDRLSHFHRVWSLITSDRWVLRTVERGYAIQFSSFPPSHPPSPSLFRDPSHEQLLIQEVSTLLAMGAIEEVPVELRGRGFYSRYFLIPKSKGGLRPILDLRGLNKFVVKFKFRMVSLGAIIPSLDPGDWFAALDMKDAYFHIAIYPPHRRFLRFVVSKVHYQFAVLPFGLSSAPRVFTKCMAVVAAYLRRQGIQVFPYLDDWLVHGRTKEQVRAHIHIIVHTFNELGILLNKDKSTLEPTQRIEFIGAVLDSRCAQAILPDNRFCTITGLIQGLKAFPTTTVRSCLTLLGHMASCTYVTRHARLRLRPLQTWVSSIYCPHRDSLNMVVTVPNSVLTSLTWWLDHNVVCEGMPFHAPQPSLHLVTDASSLGWGAHLNEHHTQGLWTAPQLALHINVRELMVVRLACQAFLNLLRGRCVLVLIDNTTAMFYIKKQGGARSSILCQEAIRLWDFCIAHSIHLTASFLPGVQNTLADRLSRSFQTHEWSIRPDIIHSVFQKWGFPQIDLFASRDNRKCHVFCSLQGRAPGSLSDAFLLPWKDHLFYAFPPFPLVHKVLLKLRRDQAQVILVAPAWPRQHWYTTLLELSVQTPIPLPLCPDLISQDHGRLRHPDLQSLHLTAWLLHGSPRQSNNARTLSNRFC
ncbi:uncharacterized protein LOC122174245 [Chrysemys picta bellii]|uniref:uncharacterized protein LOC122174245 n=1 Tax=Chrysemys picta bellii TaxID=8478 RepID=UPI0032B20B51